MAALKEIGDALGWWPGRASARDAAADLLGSAVGAAAAAALERRRGAGELLPVAHAPSAAGGGTAPRYAPVASDDDGDLAGGDVELGPIKQGGAGGRWPGGGGGGGGV